MDIEKKQGLKYNENKAFQIFNITNYINIKTKKRKNEKGT